MDEARLEFACPPRRGLFSELDLELLDPADPDDRHFLILAEHEEFAQAIEDGQEEVLVGGEPVNPRLHVTIHEVVASQLWADDPPEVWQTARRLLDAGYERHDILHMIGSAFTTELWTVWHEGKPGDTTRYVRALQALR
jgi:Domain of unknown function (DUF1841)